ncbi:hypothetical protein [Rhodoplanes sp. SY1]|uniref:hypothetical protein n=1 Tax=Rhodoplanes sp. SY1 TaxID=3166646 RepID=UPI0038B4B2DE
MPEPRLLPENREKDHPVAVGWISCHRGRFELLQPIPLDATTSILQMLIADRFHFITLSATRLKHGKANVQTFHLVTHIDADDLPLES